MGAASAKPARAAPVRYVAKQLPRVDTTAMEKQFRKPQFTAQGINTRQDNVNTEPLMYVETSKDGGSTEITEQTSPRWYLNTYMEMMDNLRTDQTIISGNLPMSWERDKYEPYSLVRGRVDHEDLLWILAPEQRKMPVEELVDHTKLTREVLQDILDTVELPRTQFRNYKGKLHKSIEDANTFQAARQEQLVKSREKEALRRIGYSEEEVAQEEQYLTKRSRGMKALDDLGVSHRETKRTSRAREQNEMEEMLEERRIEAIERGELKITEEDLYQTEEIVLRPKHRTPRKGTYKKMYAADSGQDELNRTKFQWWLDRTRRIKRGVDKIHGVPVYNERLSANEEQTRKLMEEAAQFNYSMSRAQGAKGFADPRGHYDQMLDMMRINKDESQSESNVEVHEDGISESSDVFRYPHTRSHPPKPTSSMVEKSDPTDATAGDERPSNVRPEPPSDGSPGKSQ